MKEINLSSDTRKIVIGKKLNFVDFLTWFKKNKDKINKEKYLIQSEKMYKTYFNNPNEYICVLIYFFKKKAIKNT